MTEPSHHSLADRGVRVVLDGVRKSFGDAPAIENVTLDIAAGEFMTLLGPSGSGKTTTLNVIAGFLTQDSGTVTIGGVTVDQLPPRKRGIGMVFQNYALFPHMTVTQNIAFPLAQKKVARAERSSLVARAVETVRLGGLESRYPAQLSGGQQQRVALARAIVFEPRLLLMDEPLGALDRTLRDSMQLELRRIHREVGCSVVMVTHDQEEALALSDRIAVFDKGVVRQVGTAAELYESPADLTVARFLGESTRLVGTVRTGTGTGNARFDYRGASVRVPDTAIVGPGEAVLLIRPEQARLVPVGTALASDQEAVPVTVLEDIYLGSGRKISVQLPDGSTGIVRQQSGGDERFAFGDGCLLAWNTSSSLLLATG
jgi:putative spermidine/putrescine transport system ATP-binding protein